MFHIKVLCLRKYKVFIISFCLVSLFSFNYCSQRASANPLLGVVVVEGGSVAVSAIAGLVGVSLVAGGAYLASNVDDTDIQYIAKGIVETGHAATALSIKADETGKQFLTWTAEGWNWFTSKVSDMVSSGSISNTGDGSYVSISGSGTYDLTSVPYDDPVFISSVFEFPQSTVFYFKVTVNDVDVSSSLSYNWFSPTIQLVLWSNSYGSSLGIAVDGVVKNSRNISSSRKISISDVSVVVPTGKSISYPIGSGVTSFNFDTASDVIGGGSTAENTQSVDDYGIPLEQTIDNTGSVSYNPTVSVPYGQSWGDISGDFGITYPNTGTGDIDTNTGTDDTTGDTDTDADTDVIGDTVGDTTGSLDTGTGVLSIPILGQILATLLKILSFLGTLISSLVDSIMKAIENDLTVADTFFVDNFNDFNDTLKDKFPTSLGILSDLKNSSESDTDFTYIFTVLGVKCTIDINFIKKIAPMTKGIASGLVAIWLCWYNYRKIYEVIRGNAPLGGDNNVPPTTLSTSLTLRN